jgi:alanine-glyoxylate transaminase/serine-glyoxylate transaminase/serine-pyruvate transaminase
MAAVRGRKSKCPSFYFDLAMIERYWGAERVYHHTAPITMNYALYEALRMVTEEGLEARFRLSIKVNPP